MGLSAGIWEEGKGKQPQDGGGQVGTVVMGRVWKEGRMVVGVREERGRGDGEEELVEHGSRRMERCRKTRRGDANLADGRGCGGHLATVRGGRKLERTWRQ